MQGIQERPHIPHPLLQQIPDSGRLLPDQLTRVGRLDVLGEHQHPQRRLAFARLDRRQDPLIAERRREANIDDREVRFMSGYRPQQPGPVLHLGDHLDVVLPQQRHQTLSQQREVLGDHYPHGNLTSTVVPAPSRL